MNLGLNGSQVKIHNESLVIDLIRRYAPISRFELARFTGLTPASISAIVNRLIQQKIVTEAGTSPSCGGPRGGRRRIHLHLVPESRFVASIMLHRLGYLTSVVDLAGNIEVQENFSLNKDLSEFTEEELGQLLLNHLKRIYDTELPVLGIGLGHPSWYPAKMDWQKVAAELASLATPIFTANNAVCTAIGEWWCGPPKPTSFLYIYLGGGIGGCFVQQKGKYDFPDFQSLEIGHLGIERQGPLCYCGHRGCIEQLAGPTVPNGQPISLRAEQLGYALHSLAHLLRVSHIVIGGALDEATTRIYQQGIQASLPKNITVERTTAPLRTQSLGAAGYVFRHSLASEIRRTYN